VIADNDSRPRMADLQALFDAAIADAQGAQAESRPSSLEN